MMSNTGNRKEKHSILLKFVFAFSFISKWRVDHECTNDKFEEIIPMFLLSLPTIAMISGNLFFTYNTHPFKLFSSDTVIFMVYVNFSWITISLVAACGLCKKS